MTWRDFTIITLTDGRKEVYLIGGILNDGTVRLFKKDYYSTDDPGDITVPQELVDRNSMVFQPVQKTKWWYQIFYRGYGYLIKKNGRPLLVKGGDLTKVLTKLHNGEMEEIIK